MPTLGLDEKVISTADFSAFQDGIANDPDLEVSVWTRATSGVQAADYEGAGTGLTSAIVLLETGFGGANNTTHTLTEAGQDNLVSFLNDNIDDAFVFVRIPANGVPEVNHAFRFGNGDSDAITTLSFTAVPEPSSSALLGFGALALAIRRRRA